MPVTPDFDQIARDLVKLRADGLRDDVDTAEMIAEQLRLIWNARGAADIAAIDDVAHTNDVPVANAIRKLDR